MSNAPLHEVGRKSRLVLKTSSTEHRPVDLVIKYTRTDPKGTVRVLYLEPLRFLREIK